MTWFLSLHTVRTHTAVTLPQDLRCIHSTSKGLLWRRPLKVGWSKSITLQMQRVAWVDGYAARSKFHTGLLMPGLPGKYVTGPYYMCS